MTECNDSGWLSLDRTHETCPRLVIVARHVPYDDVLIDAFEKGDRTNVLAITI